jgi:hypothetical protein
MRRFAATSPQRNLTLYRDGRDLAFEVLDGPNMPQTPTRLIEIRAYNLRELFCERWE